MQHQRRMELKEDELVTYSLKAWTYAQENSAKLLAVAGGIVILALVGYFTVQQSNKKAADAANLLGQVQVALLSDQTGEAILLAERVVEEYSRQPAADQALLILGNLYLDLGRTAEARATFQKRLDRHGDSGPGGYAAWAGLATTLEQMGNLSEAADEFRTYADRHPESPFASVALEEAARCFRLAGDTNRAVELYRRIVEQHPESDARQTAEDELMLLGQSS